MCKVLLICLLGFVCIGRTVLTAAPKGMGIFDGLTARLQKQREEVDAAEEAANKERERLEKEKTEHDRPSAPPTAPKVVDIAPPTKLPVPGSGRAGFGKGTKSVEGKEASALVGELNNAIENFWGSFKELITNSTVIEAVLGNPLGAEEKQHLAEVGKNRRAWVLDAPKARGQKSSYPKALMEYFEKEWKKKDLNKTLAGLVKKGAGNALMLEGGAIVAWNRCGRRFNVTFGDALSPCWDIACGILGSNLGNLSTIEALKEKIYDLSAEDITQLTKVKAFMLAMYAMTVERSLWDGEVLFADKVKNLSAQIDGLKFGPKGSPVDAGVKSAPKPAEINKDQPPALPLRRGRSEDPNVQPSGGKPPIPVDRSHRRPIAKKETVKSLDAAIDALYNSFKPFIADFAKTLPEGNAKAQLGVLSREKYTSLALRKEDDARWVYVEQLMEHFQSKLRENAPGKSFEFTKKDGAKKGLELNWDVMKTWADSPGDKPSFVAVLDSCLAIMHCVLGQNATANDNIAKIKEASHALTNTDKGTLAHAIAFICGICAMTVDKTNCEEGVLYTDKMKSIGGQIQGFPIQPFVTMAPKPVARKVEGSSSVSGAKSGSAVRPLFRPKPSTPEKKPDPKVIKPRTIDPVKYSTKSIQPDLEVVDASPIGTVQRIIQHLSKAIDCAKTSVPSVKPEEKREHLKSSVTEITPSLFKSSGSLPGPRVMLSSSPELKATREGLRPIDPNLDSQAIDIQKVVVDIQSTLQHLSGVFDAVAQGRPIEVTDGPVVMPSIEGSSTKEPGVSMESDKIISPPPPPPHPSLAAKAKPAGGRKKVLGEKCEEADEKADEEAKPASRGNLMEDIRKGVTLRKVSSDRDNTDAGKIPVKGNGQMEEYEKKLQSLTQSKVEKQGELDESGFQAGIKNLDTEIRKQQAEIKNLEVEINNLNTEIEKQKAKINNLEVEINKFVRGNPRRKEREEKFAEANAEIKKLRDRRDGAQTKIKELNTQINISKKSKSETQEKEREIKERISCIDRAIDALKKKIAGEDIKEDVDSLIRKAEDQPEPKGDLKSAFIDAVAKRYQATHGDEDEDEESDDESWSD